MSIWSARELPKLRDHAVAALAAASASGQFVALRQDPEAGRRALEAARLYWVSEQMTLLADHTGQSLTDACWASEYRPAPCGLVVLDGDLAGRLRDAEDIPVRAVSWGPYRGGLMVWAWGRTAEIQEAAQLEGMMLMAEFAAYALTPLTGLALSVDPVWLPFGDDIGPVELGILRMTQALWHLMAQPGVTEDSAVAVDRKIRAAYGRASRPVPAVRLVELRRGGPVAPARRDDGGPGREYRVRWIVDGHWRDQAWGPGRSMRRRIWISPYVKGPQDAPLLGGEKVRVLRRPPG